MLKHLISDASQSVARTLRKGSQLLGTLAYLLHPEGGLEGSQTPSRGSDPPPEEDDSPSFPVGVEFAVPPDAEQMIAKPLPPSPRMPAAPLAGSIKDRMGLISWYSKSVPMPDSGLDPLRRATRRT